MLVKPRDALILSGHSLLGNIKGASVGANAESMAASVIDLHLPLLPVWLSLHNLLDLLGLVDRHMGVVVTDGKRGRYVNFLNLARHIEHTRVTRKGGNKEGAVHVIGSEQSNVLTAPTESSSKDGDRRTFLLAEALEEGLDARIAGTRAVDH